ncbi:hypothetical protein [Ectopseudomonas hydrolytica]|uniref:hypothetical protein n=1 Tax=Ectopseudomonas hydrolytica TaxID=2493633 RepID=UPI0018A6E1DC|nr:hypothetical protein [Pseudomonas hydrolytica]MBF8164054.1 hypothetical protein [Pseudomonas mendocina]UTH33098.1 hypothetical protein NLY38_07245 [Pseudomonas hydrolytica]UZZ12325.1 hypothetical protein NDO41_07570 [Pseudomonas mendocina]
MKNYAVFLEGSNFELTRKGAKEVVGFFVTVRVETASEDEATALAIEIVKSYELLKEAFNPNATATPRLEAKVVHELLPSNKMKNTEPVFFPMADEA